MKMSVLVRMNLLVKSQVEHFLGTLYLRSDYLSISKHVRARKRFFHIYTHNYTVMSISETNILCSIIVQWLVLFWLEYQHVGCLLVEL